MNLSKKAEYAVRAVAILGSRGVESSIQAQELSRDGGIPHKFLEQILLILKRGGVIDSKRGVGGGYRIAREPRLISVWEVVNCIEGEIAPELAPGKDFPGAEGITHCFKSASKAYIDALQSTSIEDVLDHGSAESMVGFGI